jgi:formylglycine-generating enzyme
VALVMSMLVGCVVVTPVEEVTPSPQTDRSGDRLATVVAERPSEAGAPDSAPPSSIGPGPAAVEFVRIPAGRFKRGSALSDPERDEDEGPQHEVAISEFELAKYEVSNAQYAAFLEANPSIEAPRGWEAGLPLDFPASGMSWHEAQLFARWAGGRLPTEAEWEYAARAGTSDSRYGPLDQIAWHYVKASGTKHPTGRMQSNAWGLYDMLGNVEEWCADWYGPYASDQRSDPSGPQDGTMRVLRGGAFRYDGRSARAPNRSCVEPSSRYSAVGFRIARDLSSDGMR